MIEVAVQARVSMCLAFGFRWTWANRRRLFRRTPPHLRGRVPVECGEGTMATLAQVVNTGDGPIIFIPTREAQAHCPPDAVGRAFLQSVAALEMPTKSKPWDPDTPVSKEEWWAHARRVEAEMMSRKPQADALEAMPTPAENARRYSEEDGTW